MPIHYENLDLIQEDSFADFEQWHHEGVGQIQPAPGGGMRLHCAGSRQGKEGCMAFFRPDLPDAIAVEYDVVIHSHGGLVINYLAIRGINGEDMIRDADCLKPRSGIMANYFSDEWGLQSYHVSFSRFDDSGTHTGTSNWRRNPGAILVGHGVDPCCTIGRKYHVRITKDCGACQFFVDGEYAHGFIDHNTAVFPIPDSGKFGIRLIGSDVKVDFSDLRIYRIAPNAQIFRPSQGSITTRDYPSLNQESVEQ